MEVKSHYHIDRKNNQKSHMRFVWTGGGKKHKNIKTNDFVNYLYRSLILVLKSRNVLYNLLLCAVILLCVSCQTVLCEDPTCNPDVPCFADSENLALAATGRSLDVSSTCGTDGITEYTKSALLLDDTLYQCDASNDTIKHPMEYMVDTSTETVTLKGGSAVEYENPNAQTYWQSQLSITTIGGTASTEWILLNLTDTFLIRYIRLIFVSPHVNSATSKSDHRPKSLCIEHKLSINDAEWLPWRYYAENCESFPSVAHQKGDQELSSVIPVCIQSYYAGDSGTDVGYGYGRQEVSNTARIV